MTAQNGSFGNALQTVDSSRHVVTENIRRSLSREGKLSLGLRYFAMSSKTSLISQGLNPCRSFTKTLCLRKVFVLFHLPLIPLKVREPGH
ncbi:hypothetical protein [Bradyrhizobium australiense]|uniref:hypothetical protein n=1 Tax=Bradyrhizobium australiense TaxID=2721161 RepID=UPI0035E2980A